MITRMRSPIALTALLALSFADSALAASGRAYTVTVSHSGPAVVPKTFDVVASGARLRAVYTNAPPGEGVEYDRIVRGEDSSVAAINSRNQTWYPAPELSPFALDSRYLSPHRMGKIKNLTSAMTETPGAAAGEHRYAGEVRYDVVIPFGQPQVKVSCIGKFVIDTTTSAEGRQWLGRVLPHTGYPDVDAALRALEGRIEGFPVHLSLEATRTYAGGHAMVDSVEVAVTASHEVRVGDSELERPSGYRQQEPVVAAPGVVK